MHLMFECEQYSEPLWELLSQAITALVREEDAGAPVVRLHAFQALYNLDKAPIPREHSKQVSEVIQEVKRAIVYRRYIVNNRERVGRYDGRRLQAHLLITLEKMQAFRRYQGKNVRTIEGLIRLIKDSF